MKVINVGVEIARGGGGSSAIELQAFALMEMNLLDDYGDALNWKPGVVVSIEGTDVYTCLPGEDPQKVLSDGVEEDDHVGVHLKYQRGKHTTIKVYFTK